MHSRRRVKYGRSRQRRTWLRRLFLVLLLLIIGLGSKAAINMPEQVLAQRVPPTPTPTLIPPTPTPIPPTPTPTPEPAPDPAETPVEDPDQPQPPAEDPDPESPPAEDPAPEDPPDVEPAPAQPPADDPPAPPADDPAPPPADDPAPAPPPAEEPAPGDPPAEQPPAEQPPAEQPPPEPPPDDPDPAPPAEETDGAVKDVPPDEPPPDDPADAQLQEEPPGPEPVLEFQLSSDLPPTVFTINLTVEDTNGNPISNFSYLVNEDNAGAPIIDVNGTDFIATENSPSLKPMASYSPIVAAGTGSNGQATIGLPDITHDPGSPGDLANPIADQLDRFLISVRAPDHKMWGQHVRFFDPDTNPGQPTSADVTIQLIAEPLPSASLEVFVFRDFRPVDGFPSFPNETDAGLEGFHLLLEDVGGEVVVDINGNTVCTDQYIGQSPSNEPGDCRTDANGRLLVEGLGRGIYEVRMIPPNGTDWVQTTTFEGTKVIDAWLEEGADGRGAPGEILVEPFVSTAYFFGFTRDMNWGDPDGLPPGNGRIEGTIRNLVPFPPFEQLTFGEPVYRPWITLTDIGRTDQQVYRTRATKMVISPLIMSRPALTRWPSGTIRWITLSLFVPSR